MPPCIQIYVRTSTNRQLDSIQVQIEECKRFCAMTYPTRSIAFTIEQCSAWMQTPPLLKNLIGVMRRRHLRGQDGQILVVYSVDRFARDSFQALRTVKSCVAHGISFHFVRDELLLNEASPEADFQRFNEAAEFAQRESEMISIRVKTHHRVMKMTDEVQNIL